MSLENIQSQIKTLRARKDAVAQRDITALFASLEEMSGIAERLSSANEKVEQRLAIQYAVMRALAESIGVSEAAAKVLQAICEVIGGEFGALWIFDRDAEELYVESLWQQPGKPVTAFAKASLKSNQAPGGGLPGTVYLNNKPVWIPDISVQTNFPRKEAALKSRLRSALLFPIRSQGEVTGVIECFSREVREPAAELIDMLDALGNQIGGFMERKQAEDMLSVRAHQQAVVAQLGQRALLGIDLQELFNEVSALVAQTLSVGFAKILELAPDGSRLLLRAGVGWKKGLVGHIYVDMGPHSQGGYSLSISQPVAVTHLSEETRFKPSAILVNHGIVSGLSVIIPGRSRPFGILGAHSTKRRRFTEDDTHFLQAVAHVLAAAIQRQEVDDALRLSRNENAVILDGIADGITAQNPLGQLVYANDAAARLVGFANSEEFLNTPLSQVMMKFSMFDEQGQPLPMDRLPGRLAMKGETPPPLTVRFKVLETGEERWSVVRAQPVLNDSGQVVMAVNIFQDLTDLKRTEMAQRLLADVGNVLDSSIDYKTRLADLARLVVPRMADWCAVDILDENQVIQRVIVTHVDPKKAKWAHELYKRFPPDPNAPTSVYAVIRNNKTRHIPVVTPEMLAAITDPELKKIVDQLSFSSSMVVPLYARGRGLGAITFVWAESGHHYTLADVALAEDLADRAALALDNARLYDDSQRLNAELEQRVSKRTNQLQKSNLRLKDEIQERKQAEKQIRSLNAELEQRVIERTRQLESANHELQREVVEHEQADEALQLSLQKTRELYELSQNIGLARTPDDVLRVLLSGSYLKSVTSASVAIFDIVWQEEADPPGCCTVLSGWNKDPDASLDVGREMALQDYALLEPSSRNEPLRILDVRSDARVPEPMRARLLEQGIASSVIFPLIAAGEWYGILSLYFEQVRTLNTEDLRHLRGLVDEAATAIYNFRLLQTEAEARRQAEEANRLKLKFLAMISHELRTPLTSIKGFATTLLADDVQWQPENQRDFIETIDLEADKLTDLIEQLLDLSRLEAGAMRIVARHVAWEDVLSTVMAQLQALTVNHQLVIETEAGLPPLRVDAARVAQVVSNLVNNAVKYSQPETEISISAGHLSDQFIKVRVSDVGQGIPLEARNKVFEAFQQLEREKAGTQGAGLGLAICRALVEAHGGRIWVDEHSGRGTTISFTLPVDPSAPAAN